MNETCPRCDHEEAYAFFEAPEDGSWTLYRCPRCYFNWRSTEGEEVTNPKLYNPKFKLNEKKIQDMDPKPPIPTLKETKIDEVMGIVDYRGPRKSIKDMEAAMAKGAREDK
jgi:hypothetical protein